MQNLTMRDFEVDVRRLLLDRNKGAAKVPGSLIEEAIRTAIMQAEAGGLTFRQNMAPFVTTTSYEVALSLPAGFAGIEAIDDAVETSLQMPVTPRSLEWMRARRYGLAGGSGPPTDLSFYVDATGSHRVIVFPDPDRAYTINATVRLQVTRFGTDPATTLPFSQDGRIAVSHRAAGNLLAGLSQQTIDLLGVDRTAASAYINAAQVALTREFRRGEGTDLPDRVIRNR